MAEKTILVCDVCGDPAIQSAVLVVGARRLKKDYCKTHLSELLKGGRPAGRGPGRPRRAPAKAAAAASARRSKRRTRVKGPRAVGADVSAEVAKLKGEGMTYRQIGQALMKRGIKPLRAKGWNPVVLARLVKRQSTG